MSAMPIIQFSGLSVTFRSASAPVQALRDVDLDIEKGGLVAIVGRSGSGKSTLAHIIGLLLTPTTGDYRLRDENVGQLSLERRARLRSRHIGLVFQKYHLLSRLTAVQNVGLPLIYDRHRKLSSRQALDRAEHCLDKVGMSDRAGHRSNTLSGGEQQRVAIARAIVNDPDIILADEPTGALDTANAEKVSNMLQALNERDGKTVLIVTHDLKVAARCRRQISISDGTVVDDAVAAPGRAEVRAGLKS